MTIHEVTDEILRSKKYSNIDKAVIERISAETIPKYTGLKETVKAVKKKLHIIHESFLPEDYHARVRAYLDAFSGDSIITDKDFSSLLMALHASTNERLGQAAEIYDYICRYINCDDSIIDIGCGFNPFALPFFTTLPKNYLALDINVSTISVLNSFFCLAGLPYSAELCDVVAGRPDYNGDILFMLKLFPLLEQQKKGCAFDVLRHLACKTSIVSFPTRSASGKKKGMEAFYAALFEKDLPPGFVIVDKSMFDNEMFYIVEKDVDFVERS